MSCEVEEIITKLKNASLENDEDSIPVLEKIISLDPISYEAIDFTPYLDSFLQSDNLELVKQSARCIAELTKCDKQRKIFSQNDIIRDLLKIIESNKSHIELLTQSSRALGNICYLNDEARNIINKNNGTQTLIAFLNVPIKCDNEKDVQFAKVRCGLISNYLLGGEEIAKLAIELNIVDTVKCIAEQFIDSIKENEELFLNILPPLSILTENVPELTFDNELNKYLSKVLADSTNPDLAEICLELLHYQAENDDVKVVLAKEGLCQTIYELLEKYKTLASSSEARALMKLACDLIVLILTGDESMHYLYTTNLLKYMENWLDSYDVDLLTTGVLALGNFARTDKHCIYMVENNIMNKLLEILSKNNGVDDDMRLQHALLSALRNLVIPKPNKCAVIEAGLVQTILPMLQIHQPPVVFKLLGTLRMTVDGQDKLALELLQNDKLISQLVVWSNSSEFPGVTGESYRLMAWLIKHAYHMRENAPDDTSLKEFVKVNGAVESMVNMLTSQHLVMQNEALIALSILSTVLNNKSDINLDAILINCNIGEKMSEFITKGSDNMTKEIVENLQSFMNVLKVNENLVEHLAKYNIDDSLKSMPILTEYCVL